MIWVGPAIRKPRNECDDCQQPLGPDDGGLCGWCAERYKTDMREEWWA